MRAILTISLAMLSTVASAQTVDEQQTATVTGEMRVARVCVEPGDGAFAVIERRLSTGKRLDSVVMRLNPGGTAVRFNGAPVPGDPSSPLAGQTVSLVDAMTIAINQWRRWLNRAVVLSVTTWP